MAKLTNSGVRFIVGVLSVAVSAVVVGSIIASSLNTLADAIRENNGSSIGSSSSQSTSTGIESSSESTEVVPLKNFTVEFNPMGGTPTSIASMQVTENDTIPSFPTVTLIESVFAGWFTGNTPSDVLFTATMPIVRDLVLYARWNATPIPTPPPLGSITYVVAFDAAGGTAVTSIQVEDGKTIRLPSTTRQGYSFLGWFTGTLPGDVLFTANTTVIRDIALVARWERQSFMITFISNGGTSIDPMVAQADSVIEAPLVPIKLNSGFEGWFLDVNLTQLFTFNTMPENSFTLYAAWGDEVSQGLIYAFAGDEYVVTGYEGIHSEITIPVMVNGFPVTEIADFAFSGNSTLVIVNFPNVEGNMSHVTTLGRSAFAGMPFLRQVNLASSLKTIKSNAFANSISLRALQIPFGVTTLGSGILTGTTSLQMVTVHPLNNEAENMTINFKYLFGGTLFSDNVEVPNSLKTIHVTEGTVSIPNDFLRNLPLITDVSIPNSIRTIGTALGLGTNILNGAANLRSLRWTFTSSVDGQPGSYLTHAFGANHTAITNLPVNLSAVIINETEATRIASYAFYNISTLDSIELPDNIREIALFTFAHAAINTSRLTHFDFPSSIEVLGNSVFANNSSLLELFIPNTVTSIGTNALTATSSLASLSFDYASLPGLDTAKFFRYFYGATSWNNGSVIPTALKTVEVRGTNTVLANDFFRSALTIETVTIPSTVTTIGNFAFSGMTQLRQVQVTGDTVVANTVLLPTGLTSIGTSVFQGSTSIVEVVIPQGVTVIPADAFNGATSLRLVTLSSQTTSIGNNAFLNTALETIVLPQTLTTLGNFAFSQTRLTTLTIPTSVTTIGTSLLVNTPQLVTINFSVDSLTTNLRFFRYFYGGTSFSAGGTLPVAPASALTTVNLTGGTILSANFFNTSTTTVAFPILTTITLADTFTSIEAGAFRNLTGLSSLTVQEGVTSIGDFALMNTPALSSLVIPASVTTIGISAFQGSGITSIVLGPNLTSIGNSAFNSMPAILQIEFLGQVPPTIGTFVFNTLPTNNLFPESLTVYIPFGTTAVYTDITAPNANYAQFVALNTALRLVEAEDPNADPVGE